MATPSKKPMFTKRQPVHPGPNAYQGKKKFTEICAKLLHRQRTERRTDGQRDTLFFKVLASLSKAQRIAPTYS